MDMLNFLQMNTSSAKQLFGSELREGWPIKLVITSVVSSGLFIGCLWLLVNQTTKNCGPGFDGLGCALGGALISEAVAVLLLLIVGAIMIHSLVLKTWSATFFCMIPAAVFVV